jgi:hypothetical protein
MTDPTRLRTDHWLHYTRIAHALGVTPVELFDTLDVINQQRQIAEHFETDPTRFLCAAAAREAVTRFLNPPDIDTVRQHEFTQTPGMTAGLLPRPHGGKWLPTTRDTVQ